MGMSHYFKGMAAVEAVDFEEPNPVALKAAVPDFKKALKELDDELATADEAISLMKSMKGTGGFQKRIRTVSADVSKFKKTIETLVSTLEQGQYPKSTQCAECASALGKITSPFERNAQVELGYHEERVKERVQLVANANPDKEDPNKDDANKEDLEKLEGTWKIVGYEVGGKNESEEQLKEMECKVIFKGKEFVWVEKGKEKAKGTFKIDAKPTPKHMELSVNKAGETKKPPPGIYKLDGDKLIFVSGKKRPKEFNSKGDPDDEMITLVKEK